MTTNELIENYGIGHNCLSDAYDIGYQKGRAEAMCEIAHDLLKEVRISLSKLKEKKNG